ncbi:T9SS type A sorting domain-containing protein [Aggregatimonas sangjinii]|uniref:T9SS type A sorting domain-containing protein n=1 Tax=Aggregatimonas sangjinii TaxID=2583587 RepID=A0A5B7SRK4_9FLAO|nr:T9SS type A sorting domain-containing protein [Aggregatimonas sangjinii]QCX01246.1 T9SS type A sorting domain-containing protein [Aggregatimonas sangjinii]
MKKFFLTIALALVVCFAQAQTDNTKESDAEIIQMAPPKLKVFPNPATSVVNVLGVLNSKKADITISDLYGTTLATYQWEIRNNALNIPISNLKAGIYLISIYSKEQTVQTKFYKQ